MAAQEHKGHDRFCRTVQTRNAGREPPVEPPRGLEQKGPRDPPPPPSSCPEHSKLPSSSPGSGQGRRGDGDGTAPPDEPRPSITEPFSQGKFSHAQLALRLLHLVTTASRPVDPIKQQTQGLRKLNPQQALRENHPTRG